MRISKLILKTANRLVNFIVLFSLIIAGLYACYALYDNNQIYVAANDVQEEMMKLKPEIAQDDVSHGPTFEELLNINPDVRAWLTMNNTNIDYPVLQGENNLSYINTDVYGNFALAGSIFLDSRNDGKFEDSYSLLYGHDMDKDKMFGNLALYKDEDFFKANTKGSLILPDKVYELETYVVLVVRSSDDMIFNPTKWHSDNISDLLEYIENNALYINNDIAAKIEGADKAKLQVLAQTTCSGEFTDARTILISVMENVSGSRIGG